MNILVIKLSALGDAVMASTMIKALQGKYPDGHITWLCGGEIAPLVRLFEGVDEILTLDNKLLSGSSVDKIKFVLSAWKLLLGKRYDLCVIAHSDRRYRLIASTLFCKKVRFGGRAGPIPGRYHGTEYARLALGLDDYITDPYPLADVKVNKSDKSKEMILLLPGGAKNTMNDDGLRRWPISHYRELAEKLLSKELKVGLIGGENDIWTEEHFAGLDVTSFIGKSDIEELINILAGAKALVSHDSGPMHMCYLVKTPLVALFGPVGARGRIPADANVSTLSADIPCSPCYDGRGYAECSSNICMQCISVDMVMKELIKLNII